MFKDKSKSKETSAIASQILLTYIKILIVSPFTDHSLGLNGKISGGLVELVESLKENLLLGIVGEGKALNDGGSSLGSLDGLDGEVGSGGSTLGNLGGLVVLLMGDSKLE